MALYLLLALSAAFALRSLVAWRSGILLMIGLAAIQDPMRKLVPGAPSWLALVTVPVFVAVVFCSISRSRAWWGDFKKVYPYVADALFFLCLLSMPAAIISLSYGAGSWLLTIFGAFSYSIIFLAVITGFHYARKPGDVRTLLSVYCLAHGFMLSGAVLQYFKFFPDWLALGDKALGFHWIRQIYGLDIEFISGFYRSGDVMGWHAAAVCIIAFILAMTGTTRKSRAWLLLSGLAVFGLLVCGRRKMVYMLPVFVVGLGWLYWQAGRQAKVWSIAGLMIIPLASVWIVGDLIGEQSSQIRYYSETRDETLDRIQVQGFQALYDTYDQSGFFGEGLGTASPGSQNLNVERPRHWQESAPSRILVELGVLGTAGFAYVMLSLVRGLWRVTRQQVRQRGPQAQYVAGLVAFFLANVGSLTVSGQILADPFIAVFLGLLVGVALSFARPEISGVTAPVPAPAAKTALSGRAGAGLNLRR
jgi:hypothetical protein